ncbi:hypothetical protein [Devosia ginsengisoli]|uniref:hypothetical protein n=1 Tax=Devosia ginsengisoli TaxID=400770 RepID=UPI0026F33098|nr:hypothetical protein [Devosia ginsengisoli]MCR6673943.1 hypothetical protein [Devosia ginsengisoli]
MVVALLEMQRGGRQPPDQDGQVGMGHGLVDADGKEARQVGMAAEQAVGDDDQAIERQQGFVPHRLRLLRLDQHGIEGGQFLGEAIIGRDGFGAEIGQRHVLRLRG